MPPSSVDQVVVQYQDALVIFLKGNPEPLKLLWSHEEDISLLNPFGTLDRGWKQVTKTLDHVSSQVRDGEIGFEILVRYETPDLAFIVEVERSRARNVRKKDISVFDLRVTTVFRREGDGWRIMHRHADQMTSKEIRPVESIV